MVLLRIPTAVQPMTGIEGLFVRDFTAMGSSSFNPRAQFLVRSAE